MDSHLASSYRHYAIPHPEWADFPKNLPPDTRIARMNRDHNPIEPDPALYIDEFTIKTRDDHNLRLRTYHRRPLPETPDFPALPLFIYMHGGGFVTGSLETDDRTCRAIAKEVQVCVVSVEYRLAPEHPFPIGFEDCWDVLKWAYTSEAAAQLKVDPTKGFLLGGTSAGANFTAGLAHRYRDQGISPPITGLVFWAGSWCHPDVRPVDIKPLILSVDEIDDAPGLTKTSIEYFWKKYGAPKDDTRYSPLLFDEWKSVSEKAYFATCGWDPRRDEGIFFAQHLRSFGLEVKENVYTGLPHGFWTTCPDLPVSRAWERDTVAGVKWLLGDKKA